MGPSGGVSLTESQHALKLPSDVKEKALQWVQAQPVGKSRRPDEAPFRRLIDFWFTAIAWAVHEGFEAAERASGSKFVSIGPNPQDVRHVSDDRVALLRILAVAEFGFDSQEIKDASQIVELGNRYAERGGAALVSKLREIDDFAEPILYRLSSVFQAAVSEVGASIDEGVF